MRFWSRWVHTKGGPTRAQQSQEAADGSGMNEMNARRSHSSISHIQPHASSLGHDYPSGVSVIRCGHVSTSKSGDLAITGQDREAPDELSEMMIPKDPKWSTGE